MIFVISSDDEDELNKIMAKASDMHTAGVDKLPSFLIRDGNFVLFEPQFTNHILFNSLEFCESVE